MKYEQLGDQAVDAQTALKFLPKSMLNSITEVSPETGRREKQQKLDSGWVKDITQEKQLLGEFGQVETINTLARDAEEQRNTRTAIGIGSISIVLLIYFLFIR